MKRAIKLANNGNFNDNIPNILRNILIRLRKTNNLELNQSIPDSTYELHSVNLNLPDGRTMKFSLTCKANYNGFIVKKLKKKNKIIEEKIFKYSLIFNWI